MIIIKRDNPQIYGGKAYLMSSTERQAIDTISDSISINRGPLVDLLRAHDYAVGENVSKQELLSLLSNAFTKEQFKKDYAQMLLKTKRNFSSVDPSQTSEQTSGTTGTATGGGGFSLGADPLSSVGNIITGVGNILGLFNKQDTTGQQIMYNQQIIALAAEKEKAKQRNKTILMVVSAIVVIGIIAFTVMYAKKQKAI